MDHRCVASRFRQAQPKREKDDFELPQLSEAEVMKYKTFWNRMRSKSFE